MGRGKIKIRRRREIKREREGMLKKGISESTGTENIMIINCGEHLDDVLIKRLNLMMMMIGKF